MALRRYPTVMFDWGDTVMQDDPAASIPMVEWPQVQAIEGVEQVLDYLCSSGRQCILATSADISDEGQIRAALKRAGLDSYFFHIYCFKNTGLAKGEAFYRHILADRELPAGDAIMVGDHFEKDVLAANAAGLHAAWFNPRSDEKRSSSMHETVHTMRELLQLFRALDGAGMGGS